MDMKWNPIIDGDLNGIPKDEELLFTIFDEEDGETYATACWTEEGFDGNIIVRSGATYYEAKCLEAWMELPEPFEPGRCDMCKHNEQWTDCFGDRWSKCELWNEPFAMADCPLR